MRGLAYGAQGADIALCALLVVQLTEARSIPNQVSLAGAARPRRKGFRLLLAAVINIAQRLKSAYNRTCCAQGFTCESSGCTTGCSRRGRRSDSAPGLQPPGSALARSTRSASSGPATEKHRSDQEGEGGFGFGNPFPAAFSVSPESSLAWRTSSWEPGCTRRSRRDPSPGPTMTGPPEPGRRSGPRSGKNGTAKRCSPLY